MPFVKGQSGNPGGRATERVFADTLKKRLFLENRKELEAIVEALVTKAATGDMAAIKEVADRLDGKSVQASTISGPDGGAIEINQHSDARSKFNSLLDAATRQAAAGIAGADNGGSD